MNCIITCVVAHSWRRIQGPQIYNGVLAAIVRTAFKQLPDSCCASQSSYTCERQYSLSVCQSSTLLSSWLTEVPCIRGSYQRPYDVIHDHVTWPDVTPSMNRDYRNPTFRRGTSLRDAVPASIQYCNLRSWVILAYREWKLDSNR